LDDNVSALSTIATIGAAARNEFLAAKTYTAAAAIAGDDADFYFIDELHLAPARPSLPFSRQKKSPVRGFIDTNSATKLGRQHVNPLALLVEAIVPNNPVDLGEQREVPTHTHILPRVDTGSQLSDDNVAGPHGFAAKHFNSASLPLAVAPVA
jgi:hypothetical protein